MKKTTKTILISCGCAVCAIGIAIVCLLIATFNRQLATPKNLSVIDNLPNGQIILQVDEVPRAKQYSFSIEINRKVTNLTSKKNFIDAAAYLTELGEYKICCRALGKTQASISEYSPFVEYSPKVRLSAPDIELNESEKRLEFTQVTNASSYKLIYGVDSNNSLLTLTEFKKLGDTEKKYFSLESLPFGEYNLQVIASGEGYADSQLSKPIVFKNYKKLETPANVNFNPTSKTLTFTSSYTNFKAIIYQGSLQQIVLFKTRSLDLSDKDLQSITKIEIFAVGNKSEFTTNSDAAVWVKD